MLLEVDDLSVRYGRTEAVRGVSLRVDEGEIVAVIGANGAGKSSLLRALIGVTPAEAGTLRLGSHDITRWDSRRRVAEGLVLVPEGRRILTSLTVDENLLMGAYARRDISTLRKEIDEIYQRFPNLAERRHLSAAVLSGGEQQMLAIGRGVLARPRLMMLDEPSLGLSPLLVNQLFSLLSELNRAGMPLLLVEQNTRQALMLAARAYVMELGRVAFEGDSAKLAGDGRLLRAYLGAAGDRRDDAAAGSERGAGVSEGRHTKETTS